MDASHVPDVNASAQIAVLDAAVPVAVAPMAGGPSSPELVAAVVRAGGAGWLAGGMKTVEAVREQVERTRELLAGPDVGPGDADAARRFGVNVFVPDVANTALPSERRTSALDAATAAAVEAHRERVVQAAAETVRARAVAAGDAAETAEIPVATLAQATPDDEEQAREFAAMVDAAVEQRWPAVSFTFGLPSPEVFARLAAAGVPAGVTVTDAGQASEAVAAGAEFLTVQGPAAGGHQGGTRHPAVTDAGRPVGVEETARLVREVRQTVGGSVPVVAAGAIMRAEDVAAVLEAGAVAAQCGTAFLLADEAGTSAAHRRALAGLTGAEHQAAPGDLDDAPGPETALTRAYTGRWARSLVTAFLREHPDAPQAYPHVNAMTGPLRKAAAAAGDLHRVHLWAGTGAARVRAGSAEQVLAALLA